MKLNLRTIRAKTRITQEEISSAVGMSQQKYSQLERKVRSPTEEEMGNIAEALLMSKEDIEW